MILLAADTRTALDRRTASFAGVDGRRLRKFVDTPAVRRRLRSAGTLFWGPFDIAQLAQQQPPLTEENRLG